MDLLGLFSFNGISTRIFLVEIIDIIESIEIIDIIESIEIIEIIEIINVLQLFQNYFIKMNPIIESIIKYLPTQQFVYTIEIGFPKISRSSSFLYTFSTLEKATRKFEELILKYKDEENKVILFIRKCQLDENFNESELLSLWRNFM